MNVRDATKYPSLFRNYWGNWTLPDERKVITPEIIENRNRFVEEFGVVREATWRILQAFGNNLCHDHPEAYRTANGGVILVCSNYSYSGEPLESLDMRVYRQLYSTAATTYIRVFANVIEMRSVMKGTERNDY